MTKRKRPARRPAPAPGPHVTPALAPKNEVAALRVALALAVAALEVAALEVQKTQNAAITEAWQKAVAELAALRAA